MEIRIDEFLEASKEYLFDGADAPDTAEESEDASAHGAARGSPAPQEE
ncbi:MAG: hypothetical protein ACOZDY_13720 [Pseudomonadota bacterium]